ncbi:hypothetical protein [Streptomyces muensis]|uniref:Uncharacterized protein n=1 Tax=Streptomyces muensis TaxID=1077944 RepID=A0A9X1Q2B7_STRM4|nr:hypothetical protein [Streptomyces muensis]MCF1597256.1 hypothetical protein [Streptomyces muensis]
MTRVRLAIAALVLPLALQVTAAGQASATPTSAAEPVAVVHASKDTTGWQ